MTSATEVLMEARRLIAEKGWTQGSYCRDENGNPCFGRDAVCFCAEGAIIAAGKIDITHHGFAPLRVMERAAGVGRGEILSWNDKPFRTKAEVLAAFDRAIELSRVESSQ